MNRRTIVYLVAIAVAAVVVVAVVAYAAMEFSVVARVDGKPITRGAFHAALEERAGREVLSQLINQKVVDQEAQRQKIVVTEADIEEELAQIKKSFPSDEAFEMTLMQYDLTLDKFREQLKSKLVMDAIAIKDIKVTEEEIKKYYDEHKTEWLEPEEIKARHILYDKEEDAKKALAKLKQGADFEDLAKSDSKDTATKDKGGDLGWFSRGKMDPGFDDVAFKLKTGELGGPAKTAYGYHVIRVDDRKPERQPSLEEIHAKVERALKLSKAKPQSEILSGMKSKANIKIVDQRYKGVY